MSVLLSEFWSQITATPLLEWIAVILAVGYVFLAAKQNSWCWMCAFSSTAIYTFLFWQVTLPFQSALNFFYMVMAGYGYYQWSKGSGTESEKPVRSWPWWVHLILVPVLLLCAWGGSRIVSSQFDSEYLLLDASINLLSVVTTFMVAHKILQNWIYWFFINLASAFLYFQVGLVLSACLFLGYVGFAIFGYCQWLKEWKKQDGVKFHPSPIEGQA